VQQVFRVSSERQLGGLATQGLQFNLIQRSTSELSRQRLLTAPTGTSCAERIYQCSLVAHSATINVVGLIGKKSDWGALAMLTINGPSTWRDLPFVWSLLRCLPMIHSQKVPRPSFEISSLSATEAYLAGSLSCWWVLVQYIVSLSRLRPIRTETKEVWASP
jgi:hypothetical protein